MFVACFGKIPRFLGCLFSSFSSFLSLFDEDWALEELSWIEEGSSRLSVRGGDLVECPVLSPIVGEVMELLECPEELTVVVTTGLILSKLDWEPPPAEVERSIIVELWPIGVTCDISVGEVAWRGEICPLVNVPLTEIDWELGGISDCISSIEHGGKTFPIWLWSWCWTGSKFVLSAKNSFRANFFKVFKQNVKTREGYTPH